MVAMVARIKILKRLEGNSLPLRMYYMRAGSNRNARTTRTKPVSWSGLVGTFWHLTGPSLEVGRDWKWHGQGKWGRDAGSVEGAERHPRMLVNRYYR